MYTIKILPEAEEDLAVLRKSDKYSYIKCFDLVRELATHPRDGTGKPERLRYFQQEVSSRRVNQTDRMIYTIYENLQQIDISSFLGHYDDR
jgi:toxin YoeB